MQEVTTLHKPKADEQTIELLEKLLERAKSGDLQSIIFIDSYQGGLVGHGWAGKPDKSMIGEMEDLKFNYFSQKYFPVAKE